MRPREPLFVASNFSPSFLKDIKAFDHILNGFGSSPRKRFSLAFVLKKRFLEIVLD